jgi:V8-like Glu-specific endopeptidase
MNRIQKVAIAGVLASISNLTGLLPGTTPNANALVVGPDNRITPDYGWMTRPGQQRTAFGKLEGLRQDGRYQSCSFAIVGRNLGLTNAHCVMDEQSRLMRGIKVYAARHGNYTNGAPRYLAAANVDMVWRGTRISPSTPQQYANDWAIVRFTTNIGDRTGWLGNDSFGDGGRSLIGRVTNYIGYPDDWPTPGQLRPGNVRGSTPSQHSGCYFVGLSDGLLLHDCDTMRGTSGSNMYTRIADNDLRIMALNNSQGWQLTNGQLVNGAVSLDRFMPTLNRLRQTGGR